MITVVSKVKNYPVAAEFKATGLCCCNISSFPCIYEAFPGGSGSTLTKGTCFYY